MTIRIVGLLAAAVCTAALTTAALTGTAHADDSVFFTSPSGNIACGIFGKEFNGVAGYVRCEIQKYDYTPPERPARCYFPDGTPTSHSYGKVFYLSAVEGGGFDCGDGGTIGRSGAVLAYGSSVTYDGLTCTSAVDGIRCSLGNKSFRVSQFSYEFS
ncbi:DUF6636 domain-containing protein [Nocardia brasiliensis]